MLSYFPVPFADELLYSLLARYHEHACNPGPKATLEDLFGCRNVRATIDLPSHLDALAARIPAGLGLTADQLAQRHTLLPYYTAGQRAESAALALQSMKSGSTAGLHLRLGLGARTVQQSWVLRYCPICFEVADTLRERFWLRCHQLAGVIVCPIHEVPLGTASLMRVGQHEFLAASAIRLSSSLPQYSAASKGLLVRIAQESARLLSLGVPERVLFDHERLREKCAVLGLMRTFRQVDLARLELAHRAGLSPLQGIFPEADDTNWLLRLLRKQRGAIRPLHAILLDIILDHAPAPTPKPRRPQSRVYLRDDALFCQRLRDAAAAGLSLRAAARELGVDTNTIRRHAGKLGLSCKWKPLSHAGPMAPTPAPAAYERWLALVAAHPGATRTELRRHVPAAYSWLYRNDREWLRLHSPERLIRTPPRPRIDWDKQDEILYQAIRDAAQVLREMQPPQRVTLAALERQIGRPRWISDRKAKLPKTVALISELSETTDAFRMRRVSWVRAQLVTRHGDVPEWKVRRAAGVRPRQRGGAQEAVSTDD